MAKRNATRAEDVAFSNLEKVFFPQTRFTKGDVIKYYLEVAPVLLPHFRNRPVTLIRFPDGVHGEKFFEKNAPGFAPAWLPTTQVMRSEGGVINYIMVNDARTLAWVANLAAIELHPFLHRADNIAQPTHLAFDLDPGEGADLAACIEVGFIIRDLLAGLKLKAFPKVSGSKGLQLYVPLHTPVTYAAATPFAKAIAELLHRQHRDLIVSDMSKALRVGKVFIDWSQNHEKKTTVGPYSLRAKRDEPFVSMPVTWAELKKHQRDVSALFFSPAEALARIKRRGDLFAPVLTLKQRLPAEFLAGAAAATRRAPRALRDYAGKRDFGKTAEPAPALPQRSAQGSRRRFVIQKHAASHLHYDFRLELHDVLKSWAVPKGLPTALEVKRSAFQTEDHPLDYFSFEGTIPAGEYGGGTVMVWDIGTYDIVAGNYWKGDLTVFLEGKKLKGEWHLSRDKGETGKPVWVIRKTARSTKAISAKQDDTSVLSGRSMAEIAAANDTVWQGNGATWETGKSLPARPSAARRASATAATTKPVKLPPLPEFIPPMTARQVATLPEGDEWVYEIKLDGYRGLGVKHGNHARLLSRKENDLGADFPGIITALRTLKASSVVLDGEIVALDEHGRPSFQLLQNRRSASSTIVYYAFDLLQLDGKDWRSRPLSERKARVAEIVAGSDVKFSTSFDGPAETIVRQVQKLGLEGVIAKRRDSVYESGERSAAWVKLKLSPEQEFVIGGFKRATPLESLVVGYYAGGKLLCAGKVRQGLTPRNRAELHALLKPRFTEACPFANLPNSKKSHWGEGITAEQMKEIQWVTPELVAQVSFTEWTSGGNLRHGTFQGLRADKTPRAVVRES